MTRGRKDQSAEFPDDCEIEGGANYDLQDPFYVHEKDPEMHYFFSVDDGEGGPDRVPMLTSAGYQPSKKRHHHPDPKAVLMEIPNAKYEAHVRANLRVARERAIAARIPGDGLFISSKGQT